MAKVTIRAARGDARTRARQSRSDKDQQAQRQAHRKESPDIKVEHSSGNVFADLGLPNPEEVLAKAEIARQVNRVVAHRGLGQKEAGVILGIPQPRVSDLARGRLDKFSLEKLIDFAKRVGIDVEIRMKRSPRPRLKVTTEAA